MYCSLTVEATAGLSHLCLVFILNCTSPAERTKQEGTIEFQTYLLCITIPTTSHAS